MRGEIINEYQKLTPENQKVFSRFLWANAVVGAILLAGLITLASKITAAAMARESYRWTVFGACFGRVGKEMHHSSYCDQGRVRPYWGSLVRRSMRSPPAAMA